LAKLSGISDGLAQTVNNSN
jgi:hypothetical protein